jgi:hypothetical protein
MMPSRRFQQGGFAVIYSVFFVLLAIAIIAIIMFRRGELLQNTARNTILESERVSADRYEQRSAQGIVSSVITQIINSGGNSISSSNVRGQASGLRQTYASADNFFQTQNSSTAAQASTLGTVGTPQFPISAWSPTSSRWSLLTTPSGLYRIFGDKPQFIGRLTQFTSRITLSAQIQIAQKSNTFTRQKFISIYEFPVQSFAASGDNIQVGSTVIGNVLARNLSLVSTANIQSASVYEGITVSSGATVGGSSLSRSFSASSGAEVAKNLEAGVYGSKIAEDKISLFRGNEFSTLVILGDTTKDAEGIPQIFRARISAPTYWDAYTLPYYQCSVRVFAQLNAAGTAVNLTVSTSDVSTITGRLSTTTRATANIPTGSSYYGFSLKSAVGGTVTILNVDPVALSGISGVGLANARALFVEFVNSSGQHSPTTIGISLENVGNLSALQGFSLVTPNRLYLHSDINWTNSVPVSIFAFDARFGTSAATPAMVQMTGQRSIVGTSTAAPIETVRAANGNSVSSTSLSFGNISNPLLVPPVTLLGWLVTVSDQ